MEEINKFLYTLYKNPSVWYKTSIQSDKLLQSKHIKWFESKTNLYKVYNLSNKKIRLRYFNDIISYNFLCNKNIKFTCELKDIYTTNYFPYGYEKFIDIGVIEITKPINYNINIDNQMPINWLYYIANTYNILIIDFNLQNVITKNGSPLIIDFGIVVKVPNAVNIFYDTYKTLCQLPEEFDINNMIEYKQINTLKINIPINIEYLNLYK